MEKVIIKNYTNIPLAKAAGIVEWNLKRGFTQGIVVYEEEGFGVYCYKTRKGTLVFEFDYICGNTLQREPCKG